jgi:hypothetical protein
MVDWLVVLIPLVLVPIVLLFAFAGCVLDPDGQGTPVTFSYPPQLNVDVHRFEASFQLSLENSEGDPSSSVVPPVTRVNEGTPPLLAAGEQQLTAGLVGVDNHGSITCTCVVTLRPDEEFGEPVELPPVTSPAKEKVEEEDAPHFELVREGEKFRVD